MDTKRIQDATVSLQGMFVMYPSGLLALSLLMLASFVPDRSAMAQLYTYAQFDRANLVVRQHAPDFRFAPLPAAQPKSIAGPVLGGVVGGAAGLAGGALIGYTLEAATCEPDEWFCGLGGLVLGGAIGEVVGLPLGVHIGNGRRGNYGRALLASFGIAAAGLLAVAALEEDSDAVGGIVLLGVPVAQLAVAVSIERATGHGR